MKVFQGHGDLRVKWGAFRGVWGVYFVFYFVDPDLPLPPNLESVMCPPCMNTSGGGGVYSQDSIRTNTPSAAWHTIFKLPSLKSPLSHLALSESLSLSLSPPPSLSPRIKQEYPQYERKKIKMKIKVPLVFPLPNSLCVQLSLSHTHATTHTHKHTQTRTHTLSSFQSKIIASPP